MVTNTTKKGLGRGLSSLMGDTETVQTKNTNVGQETKIPIANLNQVLLNQEDYLIKIVFTNWLTL